MSKKQNKASKKPAKLSALEKRLLGYAKKYQPVLLYGKDTLRNGREDLIRNVHLGNGGIDYSWEYVGSDKSEFKNEAEMKELVYDEWNDNDADSFMTTPRTWICIDCSAMNGKEIFETMTNSSRSNAYYTGRVAKRGKSKPSWSPYINRKGLIFVNNLHCKPEDNDDKYYYEKLSTVFEKRKNDNSPLICYARNVDSFPKSFTEQFELVSLDSKDKEKKDIKLRGKKTHYIQEKERGKIIIDIVKTHPRESNTFIARKAMSEIEKKHGTKPDGKPFYIETTLAKEVSKLKNKRKRRKNVL